MSTRREYIRRRSSLVLPPQAINGLGFFIDPRDPSSGGSPRTMSGGQVVQLDDLSGQGNHASQVTPAAQPTIAVGAINGNDALFLPGFLTVTVPSYTAFTLMLITVQLSDQGSNNGIANAGGVKFQTGVSWNPERSSAPLAAQYTEARTLGAAYMWIHSDGGTGDPLKARQNWTILFDGTSDRVVPAQTYVDLGRSGNVSTDAYLGPCAFWPRVLDDYEISGLAAWVSQEMGIPT